MEYVWAAIIISVLVLILWGIIAHKITQRKLRKATAELLPTLVDHIQVGRRYNIFLSHGKMLKNVQFLGISPAHDANEVFLPFPLCQWLIVLKETGRKAYIKPQSVRYYEESEP